MSKVLINLDIPALGEKYDLFVPTDVEVGQIIGLLAKSVNELSLIEYVSSGQEFLCSKEKQITFEMDRTLESYGILNGDHLALI